MKKLIITLAVLAAAAFSANAQLKFEAGVSFGNYLNNNYYNSAPGFVGRVLYDIPVFSSVSEDFFVEVGLGYVDKNAKLKSDKTKFNVNWLEIPVLFGSNFDFANNSTLCAKLGFYYGYNLSQKTSVASIVSDVANNASVRPLKRSDFGFEGQVIYYYTHFGIGIGYEYGILNIAQQPNSKAHSDAFYILASFRF